MNGLLGPGSLGRTDLRVCRLGVGCGNGLSSEDVLYAFDRGVNFFFYSSDLHAQTYQHARDALKSLCGRGSARRERVVLAACSYLCDPEKVPAVVVDHLMTLKVDYVDVFMWGWVTRNSPPELMSRTRAMLSTATAEDIVDQALGVPAQVAAELHARGYARYLGISTHDRGIARALAADPDLDVLMVRYNAAHRGAERDIFPHLSPESRPGVVVYNSTHTPLQNLTELPDGVPADKYHPTHGDLYRYALEREPVDVVLSGPRTRDEIDHALEACARGPLHPRVRHYLEMLGDLHGGRAALRA